MQMTIASTMTVAGGVWRARSAYDRLLTAPRLGGAGSDESRPSYRTSPCVLFFSRELRERLNAKIQFTHG